MKCLNFNSLLIITYGRSGSTLLQGVLNTPDNVLIRGENWNFCFHLFKSYQAIAKTKNHCGDSSRRAFYGNAHLDEKYFIEQMQKTVKEMLIGDEKGIGCYGFKEIRYSNSELENEASDYLNFLESLFPNPCFIFNTRNQKDVVDSWHRVGWESDKVEAAKEIEQLESNLFDLMNVRKDKSFHITYEDVIGKSHRLKELFDFVGMEFDAAKIDNALSRKHSFHPRQEHVQIMER